MVVKGDLDRIGDLVWEISQEYREDMRVPARVYADEALLDAVLQDRSLEQLINTSTLPGVVKHVLAMPDMHQGYGFPIGGVAATKLPDGVISPGGVGYDINCGVRLLSTGIQADALRPHMDDLMSALYDNVATGVGASSDLRVSESELNRVLDQGGEWAVERGYGIDEDLSRTEEGGRMTDADASAVSSRAKERGLDQIGTLGSGNHFLQVDWIEKVHDQESAEAFGLREGEVVVWIHCGSRGLGHQVCTDWVRKMQPAVKKYDIELPDRELVCAPFSSDEGQEYYKAMCAAANYAWANRQTIAHLVRRTFEETLPEDLRGAELRMVYDVCHNIAKTETHTVNNQHTEVCVHRKGATRAFGPARDQVPSDYRDVGQPVLIPGNMQAGSYVLVGTDEAMAETFGSTCHGAGRTMSRTQARKEVRGEELRKELEGEKIVVRAGSMRGLAEEAPTAYKALESVVSIVHDAGIARRVARTRPMGVIKG